MKCFECGGEFVAKRDNIIFYTKDKSPVFFEDIPLNECVQCGEKYIAGDISEKISEVLNNDVIVTEKKLTVPVVSIAA